MSWVQGSRKAKTKAQRNITVNSNKNKGEKKERDVAALGWDIWKSFAEIFFFLLPEETRLWGREQVLMWAIWPREGQMKSCGHTQRTVGSDSHKFIFIFKINSGYFVESTF